MNVTLVDVNGVSRTFVPIVSRECDRCTVTVPLYLLRGEKLQYVEIDPCFPEARAGDEGYMLSSGGIHTNTTLLYYREREDTDYTDPACVMPMMGMRLNGKVWFAIATGMDMSFRARYQVKQNRYRLTARFELEGDPAYEAIQLTVWHLPEGDYNTMAHIYRDEQVRRRGLRPIRERIREKPALAYAADSIEIRIRHAWKPSPSPIPHQSPDNEPPMLVVCDFDRVSRLLDEFATAGIRHAEICLVGWNRGGHDGRFPQLFPAEPLLGGNEKLQALLQKAADMGYNMVCHDNYTAAYECAECWDEEFVVKFKDGRLGSRHYDRPLSGGIPYLMCPQRAYERFAVNRLPKYRQFGFRGLHFVDVFSAVPPRKCYDWRHPNTFADCRDYYLKTMRLASENMGGFQSEGPFDFVAPELDYCMYTRMYECPQKTHRKEFPLCDEVIPFWEIVYHGYILSNPETSTVNYTLKGKQREARLMAVAGRPLMYLHSKFGSTMNWMGDDDLHCTTDEEIAASVREIRKAYDLHERYRWLQYEFLEQFDLLEDGSRRALFSDGTVILSNAEAGTYEVLPGDGHTIE